MTGRAPDRRSRVRRAFRPSLHARPTSRHTEFVVNGGSRQGIDLEPSLQVFVRTELTRLLGPRAGQDFEVVHTTDTAAVLLTSAGPSQKAVFKVARLTGPTGSIGTDFHRTAAVVGLARAAGVPAPQVLTVDTSGRAGPWQYLLQEHVSGLPWRQVRPLLDQQAVAAAHLEIAEALLKIQTVRFTGFGELDGSARPAGVPLLAALRRRADRILQQRDRQAFLDLLARQEPLFVDPLTGATLSHDDLHHGNVLFARRGGDWRLAGVIDWDKAWAGPAESDVARMAFWDDMTGSAFWQAYDRAGAVTTGRTRRSLIYQLLWCLEYDDGSDRHATDTANLWQRLADL